MRIITSLLLASSIAVAPLAQANFWDIFDPGAPSEDAAKQTHKAWVHGIMDETEIDLSGLGSLSESNMEKSFDRINDALEDEYQDGHGNGYKSGHNKGIESGKSKIIKDVKWEIKKMFDFDAHLTTKMHTWRTAFKQIIADVKAEYSSFFTSLVTWMNGSPSSVSVDVDKTNAYDLQEVRSIDELEVEGYSFSTGSNTVRIWINKGANPEQHFKKMLKQIYLRGYYDAQQEVVDIYEDEL